MPQSSEPCEFLRKTVPDHLVLRRNIDKYADKLTACKPAPSRDHRTNYRPLMIRRLFLTSVFSLTLPATAMAWSGTGESLPQWPQRPVRIVVAAPAGSSVDVVARLVADGLKELWAQTVIVDNKPAAGGTAAATEVAKAAGDGYTLFLGFNGPLATAPSLYSKLGYDPARDFTPVVLTGSQPNLLAVNASLPVNNLSELIAYARARPGKLNYASVGNGSSSHLCMELLKQLAAIDIVHVPFNGGPPATQAVAAGDVQALFAAPSNLLGLVKAGKLKAIAVTSLKRFTPTANIPTITETGIPGLANFEALAWNGLVAPVGTPKDVILRINKDVNLVLSGHALRARLFDAGIDAGGGSPADFATLIASETRKWGAVIRTTGASVD